MTSYEELNEAERQQVDACVWLIKNNAVFNLDEHQEKYIKDHIANTILACLYITQNKSAQNEPRKGKR